ncbi:MAG: tyrosine-type recombinase/integrase [Verrucomicrobiota bacterium]
MWIYKRKNSSYWWIGYRKNGRQYLESTKTTDREKAEKTLEKLKLLAATERAGALTDTFYRHLTGGASNAELTLKAAVAGWLTECEGANSPGTVREYRTIADAFLEFMHASDTGPALVKIGTEDVRAFLAHYLKARSATTCNKARKILKVLFSREMANGRLDKNPVAAIKPLKIKAEAGSERRPFTLAEVGLMYAKAPDDFWRYAILAGFYTGLRLGDLISLRWGAVDFNANFIRTMMQKTAKPVAIPMAAKVRAMLLARHAASGTLKTTDFIWPDQAALYVKRGAGPFSNQFYDEILLPCGLVQARNYRHVKDGVGRGGKRQATGVSFHCLRHTFVSALKVSGGNQAVAKELAGHGSDVVSNLYTHLPEETLTKAIQALPEVII